MSISTKQKLSEDMKAAMKSQNKELLTAIRLILAAFKQIEVDERIEIDDERAILILSKMCKQRHDSIHEFAKANRTDLIEIEQFEINVINTYLPPPLSESEINTLIKKAIIAVGGKGISDMGKVMAFIKPTIQGKADLGSVSAKIKELLA